METDFRAFFLQLEKPLLKLGGIQFSKHIPTGESLFLLEETDFLASGNHFVFSIFQGLLPLIIS